MHGAVTRAVEAQEVGRQDLGVRGDGARGALGQDTASGEVGAGVMDGGA